MADGLQVNKFLQNMSQKLFTQSSSHNQKTLNKFSFSIFLLFWSKTYFFHSFLFFFSFFLFFFFFSFSFFFPFFSFKFPHRINIDYIYLDNRNAGIGPNRLYVGSVHFNVTEDDLSNLFSPFGELEFINLHKDESGRSKGFGMSILSTYF